MYIHITKAGKAFQDAMFKYYEPLVNQEQIVWPLKRQGQ